MISKFEDILCFNNGFLRVHKSYIVNLENVVVLNKSNGGSLELNFGYQIPVSSDKIQYILDEIQIIKR
ncbi:LytTR family DNA-binding domain-containing protein [Chryseobacterium sp. SNU WT5]|uniref:LytTR family transcriptional regulator DNA-binding domain-containing protein n=1 Tax=Chryseobacterium sp. SNU WT5 TaxID=2594269 RepID=UPI00162A89A8